MVLRPRVMSTQCLKWEVWHFAARPAHRNRFAFALPVGIVGRMNSNLHVDIGMAQLLLRMLPRKNHAPMMASVVLRPRALT